MVVEANVCSVIGQASHDMHSDSCYSFMTPHLSLPLCWSQPAANVRHNLSLLWRHFTQPYPVFFFIY